MKPDLNITLNKLISYALDNLLLDSLDETYTLNRLASACGFSSPKRNEDVDYGDCSLESLIAELKEAAPAVDPVCLPPCTLSPFGKSQAEVPPRASWKRERCW